MHGLLFCMFRFRELKSILRATFYDTLLCCRAHSRQPCLVQLNGPPGLFTPSVWFACVSVYTGLELWCGPNNCPLVHLEGAVSDRCQVNSGAVLLRFEHHFEPATGGVPLYASFHWLQKLSLLFW